MPKKKGPDAVKRPGPKRKAEAKRLFNSKQLMMENQEILLKFEEDLPGITFNEAGAVVAFVQWLEDNDYIIFDAKRMVRLSLEID